MHYTTRSFIGHPTDVSWSQYWENEPDDPAIRSSHGHLFGLINLQTDVGADPSPLGHQLIQEINTSYFGQSNTQILSSLQSIIESIVGKPEYQLPELTVVLAVIHHSHLYLCSFNPGRVIFQRFPQISPILQGLSHQITTLSGPLQPGDRFLLTTDAFFTQYGWDRLKTFLAYAKIQDVEENFMSLLYSLDRQSLLAAALIETHADDPLPVVSEVSTTASVGAASASSSSVLPPVLKGGAHRRWAEGLFSKIIPQKPDVYVAHHQSFAASRRKKINLAFGILVLGILSTAIYLGSVRNQKANLEKKYQSLKTQYQTKYDNALAIKNINLTESQTVAQDANKVLGEMLLLKVHTDEITGFQSQINTLLSQTGSPDAYKPELFFDTSLIGANARYQLSFLSKGQLYLLDNNSGRLDQLDVAKKSYKNLIQNPDLSGVNSLAVDNGQILVLKNSQILEIRSGSLVPRFDAISQIPRLTTGQIHLWNGSLYLLVNPGSSPSLWKFAPSASGFSAGKNWLKDGQSLPTDTANFAINGSIWTLSRTGQISSYNLGTKDKTVINSTFALANATNLVTGLDTDILAFSHQNLVYINKKSTNSVSSYNFGDKSILSLSLDAPSKTVFILCSDQKIYKISL